MGFDPKDSEDQNPKLVGSEDDSTLANDPSEENTWAQVQQAQQEAPPLETPDWIGDFEVLRRLGEGGMGVVYEAIQQNPHRHVALKVIRGGVHIDEYYLRMFEQEAYTLGLLKHPNIAGIYASGYTEEGFPYYAMELVQGVELSGFMATRPERVDQEELNFRLQLFIKVCNAIHYAHQRGVIHRDLKPSNIQIEVDAENSEAVEPKVLDFGLARLMDSDPESSMATQVGVLKGTLFYMSPEQAQGLPDQIDLRSDVYSLGVILYEMLVGQRPFNFENVTMMQAVEKIVSQAPESISESWRGYKKLDRDLETIVLKALEKEPDRRYHSAAALADDLERYLKSEPILARPPSTAYQLKKFAQRNKVLVGGIAATALTLVLGAVFSTMFALKESKQRREVEATKARLESVVDFQSEMLANIDPRATGQAMVNLIKDEIEKAGAENQNTVLLASFPLEAWERLLNQTDSTDMARHLVDQQIILPTERAIEQSFVNEPVVAAQLYQTLGETLRGLGLYQRSEDALEKSLALFESALGKENLETIYAQLSLADTQHRLGRTEQAVEIYRNNLPKLSDLDKNSADALKVSYRFGTLLQQMNALEESLAVLESTYRDQAESLGAYHEDTINSLNVIAGIHRFSNNLERAEAQFRVVLERRTETLGLEDPNTIAAAVNLGNVLRGLDRSEEALTLVEPATEKAKLVLGGTHPTTLRAYAELGNCYRELGQLDRSLATFRTVVSQWEKDSGELHPKTLDALNNLGYALMSMNRLDESLATFEVLLRRDEQVYAAESPQFALHKHSYAEALMASTHWQRAHSVLTEVIAVYESTQHRYRGLAYYQMAQVAAQRSDFADLFTGLEQAIQSGYLKTSKQLDDALFEPVHGNPRFEAIRRSLAPSKA